MRSVRIVLCFLVFGAVCLPAARAIPSFARREGVPCQMCHFRVPELNADGRAYLLRGFREEPGGMGGEEAPPTATAPMAPAPAPPVSTPTPTVAPTPMAEPAPTPAEAAPTPAEAAPTPAEAAPAMETPEGHPLGEPLSLDWSHYLSIFGAHEFTAAKGERPTFDAGELDLFLAGSLNPQWSAMANPLFNIQDGGSEVGQVYGQFITHWAAQFGSVRAGQILPFAILYNQGDMRMPLSAPVSMEASGDTGYGWSPTTSIRGVEASAVHLPGWNVTLGAGQPQVDAPEGSDGFETRTDVYASAERYFGDAGNSLSAYGYLGHAWLSPTATHSQFHRLGLFANLYLGSRRFDAFNPTTKTVFGILTGKDKDVNNRELDNTGYFALVEQHLSDRLAAYARYDGLRQDLSAGGSSRTDGPALGITFWPATEVRLTAEGQSLKTTDQSRDNRLTIDLLWVL